jgi:hypothetical protein
MLESSSNFLWSFSTLTPKEIVPRNFPLSLIPKPKGIIGSRLIIPVSTLEDKSFQGFCLAS